MKYLVVRAVMAVLSLSVALPALAHGDRDGRYRHDGDYGEYKHHKHHRHHRHERGYYASGGYAAPGCMVEGWYDRAGYYRERQVCRGARVGIPLPPPPSLFLQAPSVVIQPPGVYIR